jgi:hypothetical protein
MLVWRDSNEGAGRGLATAAPLAPRSPRLHTHVSGGALSLHSAAAHASAAMGATPTITWHVANQYPFPLNLYTTLHEASALFVRPFRVLSFPNRRTAHVATEMA